MIARNPATERRSGTWAKQRKPNAADKKKVARRLTRETLKLRSDEIMRNPGDWYWFNKRWILEPV